MTDLWRGCVTVHRDILHIKVPSQNTKSGWAERSLKLHDTPENRRKAERKLREVRDQLLANVAATGQTGPPTVRVYAEKWFDEREAGGLTRVGEDRAKFAKWVYPAMEGGDLLVEEVRPRHLVEMVKTLRAEKKAPRTVRNVYYLAKAFLRDAAIAEIIPLTANPAILNKVQLGKKRDGKVGWRAQAVFGRDEFELVISDHRVPPDRRLWYGLLCIGALRTGEAAGLRWRAVQDAEPLDRMVVMTSYDDGTTKTEIERWMPIHPTLSALLAEWKLAWGRTFGRPPTADDLVLPRVQNARSRKKKTCDPTKMRIRQSSWKHLQWDLKVLGMRGRRVHDLRRTGISLYRADGAERDRLRRGTHAPSIDMMELYTEVEWKLMCAEIGKLKVRRRRPSEVVDMAERREQAVSAGLVCPVCSWETGKGHRAGCLAAVDLMGGA